ncbi:ferrochelatase [Neorickettsia risticii str. Illinois]|uniref:Ferrochelatase n=1 Tax=Neorickettsia risticii (strain Illinois) TaxID=434131 RepID=C6V5R2_NEORI|nr:ferrochelatase [Neorickettsia risticii]ACT69721.1 ferrochelatase [Neorickettsia risticii str. Illinois]
MSRVAVVLLNLGGPDSLEAVQPFLFNLFCDRRIINLPNPFRYCLAWWISCKRSQEARKIYSQMGGKSSILPETNMQAKLLGDLLGPKYEVFVAMRHWHPFIHQSAARINGGEFKKAILLPLYPQFSTTTSLSSIEQCFKVLRIPTRVVCCYYDEQLFIEAHVETILPVYTEACAFGKPIILFSAHGLPLSVIEAGDPYKFQVEESVNRIVAALKIEDLDWELCYQSKVGKAKWLSPDAAGTIKSHSGRPIVVVPIAFVSEHSETRVELDIEYASLARAGYFRVPTLSAHPKFIRCLAELCLNSCERVESECSMKHKMCFCRFETG